MFNYSTGPVELSTGVRQAMATAPSTSHSAEGQALVTETLLGLKHVLKVPDDFTLFMLPGSIRQALHVIIGAACQPGDPVTTVVDGYWGELLAKAAASSGAEVTKVSQTRISDIKAAKVVTAVHMETETGHVFDLSGLKGVRETGSLVIVDAACTTPVHPLDYDLADVVVLGSHKCLAGPPGLAIVVMRKGTALGARWSLRAFSEDADARLRGVALAPPFVTYPSEILAGVRQSLAELAFDRSFRDRQYEAVRHLRAGLLENRFDVYEGPGEPSNTVTRVDLPAIVDGEHFRAALADFGYFIIGNVGASSGGSIRIGTMSPAQVDHVQIANLLRAMVKARTISSDNSLTTEKALS